MSRWDGSRHRLNRRQCHVSCLLINWSPIKKGTLQKCTRAKDGNNDQHFGGVDLCLVPFFLGQIATLKVCSYYLWCLRCLWSKCLYKYEYTIEPVFPRNYNTQPFERFFYIIILYVLLSSTSPSSTEWLFAPRKAQSILGDPGGNTAAIFRRAAKKHPRARFMSA